jgi:hypothetical protein
MFYIFSSSYMCALKTILNNNNSENYMIFLVNGSKSADETTVVLPRVSFRHSKI